MNRRQIGLSYGAFIEPRVKVAVRRGVPRKDEDTTNLFVQPMDDEELFSPFPLQGLESRLCSGTALRD